MIWPGQGDLDAHQSILYRWQSWSRTATSTPPCDELKARAVRAGVSFNAYLRDLLTEAAARPTREAILARIAARSEAATRSSVEFVRAERDQRSTIVTDPACEPWRCETE